jgi:hypothetical protein
MLDGKDTKSNIAKPQPSALIKINWHSTTESSKE